MVARPGPATDGPVPSAAGPAGPAGPAGSLAGVSLSDVPNPGVSGLLEPAPVDDAALLQAFVDHRGELTGVARRSLGDAQLAEEVVQETFIRAWRSRGRFDAGRGSLRTWLFAIQHRLVVDTVRARQRRVRRDTRLEAERHAPVDPHEAAVTSWQVAEALARLSHDHRTVVVAVYFEGSTSSEVADRLGIPEGTVRSRLFYALKSLHPLLAPDRGEP